MQKISYQHCKYVKIEMQTVLYLLTRHKIQYHKAWKINLYSECQEDITKINGLMQYTP